MNFPSSPTLNQLYSFGGRTWKWNGTGWQIQSSTGPLNVAGGGTGASTLTGYVKGNGTSAFTAVTTIPGSDITGAITGAAGSVANAVTFNNSGTGDASGTTFNGSVVRTISSNTLGAVALAGDTMTGSLYTRGAFGMRSSSIGGNPIIYNVSDQTGNVVLEIGRTDGSSSSNAVDFHSGATSVDYDSRIMATGGTGSVGGGTLNLQSGALQWNGVSLVTISSTDTLTNKTISGGTFSGTIAGAPTFTSSPTYSTGSPGIYFNETDQATDAKLWLMVVDGQNYQFQTRTDANVFVATPFQINRNGNATATGIMTANSFTGIGTNLTALNATQLTSGTVPTARLGSGTASSSTLLRGDSTWVTPGRIFAASTENTSSTKQNQWAKLATMTLTAQFADVDLGLTIRGNGPGAAPPAHARLAVRVKQQNALGGVPIYSLFADGLVTLSLDRFAIVITQNDGAATVAELWIKAPRTFELYYAYEHTQIGTNYTVAYTTGSIFQAALPSAVNGNAVIVADSFPIVLSNAGTGDFGVTLSYGGTLTADRQINLAVGDRSPTWSINGDLTFASNFTTAGANSLTLTTTASTNVTLPTTGTLATLAGTETFSNKTFNTSTVQNVDDSFLGVDTSPTPRLAFVKKSGAAPYFAVGSATIFDVRKSSATNITNVASETFTSIFSVDSSGNATTTGTLTSNGGKILTLAGNLTTSGAFATTLTTTGTTTVTLPTTGTLTTTTGTGATGTWGIAISGNAGSATVLQTARNINGVSFNGSADITVTAAAGTLTGATLAAGVTASSLTSLGTLTGLNVTTSGSNASIVVTDTGVNGANIRLVGNGGTTPNKTVRVNSGVFEVINNAYSAPILSVTDGGALTVPGTLTTNGGKVISLAGNLTTSGAFALTFTTTGTTSVTLPTTGTLATLAGTETLTNKSLTSPTMTGVPIAPTAAVGTNTTQVATTAFVRQHTGLFTVGPSPAPSSPLSGDRWLCTDNGRLYTYFNDGDSSQWAEFEGDYDVLDDGQTIPIINPTTPKDGDYRITGSVVEFYANAAWRQVFPAVYS